MSARMCLAACLVPGIAWAHVAGTPADGFATGLLHPVSGADHVLAMMAVGLWGAQLGLPALWILPVTFPLVMALGGFLGLVGIPVPAVEIGIAASALVLGAMILGSVRPPLWLAMLLVGAFAVFHGHAHGTEVPAGQSALSYSLGFVIATGMIHAGGIAIGFVHRWHAGRLALRLLGMGVALGGVWFLAAAIG